MSDDAEPFGENPFRDMDPRAFPKWRATRFGTKPKTPEDAQNEALFLRAFERLPIPAKRPARGFTLGDQCALPDLKSMKKSKKAALPAREEKTVPEAIQEDDPFIAAMASVRPLTGGSGRRISQRPSLRPAQPVREDSLDDFMAGRLEFAISSTDEYMEGHVTGLDELILNRLRSGQFSPEAHLDLHGLNASQAFEALREFMRQSWLKDLRVVLIVTGRGRNSPAGQGILRQKLQTWLTREPFKRIILGFCTARPHDGGAGAIYVLMRRFRKKGKIQWDRIYIDDD